MNIHLLEGDIHLIDLRTRMPFKYGIATLTAAPHAFVRVRAEIDGVVSTGVAADLLPPRWFTKDPSRSVDDEIDEMLEVIEHAVACARGLRADSPWDAWRALWDEQDLWGRTCKRPPLLTHFGTSLVERGLLDAFCRARNERFHTLLVNNDLGIRLDALHPVLAGQAPADLLPAPAARVRARHTVGLSDPLVDEDIPPGERLDDGLPQSLAACIDAYGLQQLKIKVSGELDRDRDRLLRLARLLEEHADHAFACSLDGDEQFRTVDEFRAYWTAVGDDDRLQPLWTDLLFVEQPFHRDVALDEQAIAPLKDWAGRPPLIIDESDGDLDSVRRALALGYTGASHKNCKGVFKGIANACLLAQTPGGIQSGEDLATIGPVALLQDLAVCSALGIETVERNGHHYFAGLSMFPDTVQRQMLEFHGELYHRSPRGWPTLSIKNGWLALNEVFYAPLGVRPLIDVEQFIPVARWRREHERP